MRFLFVRRGQVAKEAVSLTPDQAHYLRKVQRLPVGHAIDAVVYGSRDVLHTRLEQKGMNTLLAIEGAETLPPSPGPPLMLVLAMLKSTKMEGVLRAVTELGVDVFWPVLAERSVPDPSPGGMAARLGRWEEIIINACQQSGRPYPTLVKSQVPLVEAAEELERREITAVAMVPEGGVGLDRVVLPASRPVAVVVGPEGDLTSEEVRVLVAAGAQAMTLSGNVLRSETAAFTGAALLMHRMGRL